MKLTRLLILGIVVLIGRHVFAFGSTAMVNKVHYTNLPGASFVLQTGTTETELGNNVIIGKTNSQCPMTFTPKVSTSLSDTNPAQKTSCPINAIHASGGTVVPDGGGYNVMVGQVQIDSAAGCDLRGLKLNWTIYCMTGKAA